MKKNIETFVTKILENNSSKMLEKKSSKIFEKKLESKKILKEKNLEGSKKILK